MRTSRELEEAWPARTAARPLVMDVPIASLATTLAPLRGPRTDRASPLAPLPLRVATRDDGRYEVLDGFKRLARWAREGHTHVPAVVEDAAGIVAKARLLEANAPRRTVSPMDEARVANSLAEDDHLTPSQIGRLLGRGRGWSIAASSWAGGSRRRSRGTSTPAASRPPRPRPSRRCRGATSRGWPRPSSVTGCAPVRPRRSSPPGRRRPTRRPARHCSAIRGAPCRARPPRPLRR